MTDREFETFAKNLFVAFPSLSEWLIEKSPDPAATKSLWKKTLASVSFAEASSVLDRWVSGELKAFSAFERDLVCTSIKAIVERDRAKRKPATQLIEPLDGFGHRDNYIPVSPVLAKAMEMKRAGQSDDEIMRFVDDAFPATPEHSQPRYKCHNCLDSGTIEVWHNTVARAVAERKMPIESATDFYRVACTCSAGEHFTTSHKYWHGMPKYSPDQYCRYTNGPIEAERERLRKWLDERKIQPLNDFEHWAN